MIAGRRCLLSSLPRSLLHSSTTASSSSSSNTGNEFKTEIDRCYDALDKTFMDTKKAYLSKTNYELIRGLLVLRICSIKPIVQNNQALIKLSQRVFGKRLFEYLLRHTFYGHFVAGADEHEIGPVIRKMKDFGVKSILDYSVEADITKAEAKEKTEKSVGQDGIIAAKKFFETIDFDQNGFVDVHEWGQLIDHKFKVGDAFKVYNIQSGRLEPLIKPMSDEENMQFDNMIRRVNTIAEYADKKGIRMMIDAEQTYFQPAIGRLALELMRKYNRSKPVIFNTYQAYLKATPSAMALDMHLARRENFHFGAKLVRGAYLEQERKRAEVMGYEDPVNPDYDATSETYHRCLTMILDEYEAREPEKVSVLVASHNEDSIRFAVDQMKRRSINPSEKVCCFGQLYGMCDQVSFSLGQAGFSVYKYVPYGPVLEVLPYLSRRALENNAIFEKAMKERGLMWKELKRRIRTGEKGGEKGPWADVSIA